jgi:hemoglobin
VISEGEVYQQIGEDGFTRLVAAFYRQVPTDDILGPMYPKDDLHGAEERLRDFLVGRFGGPQRYMERRGHPRLRMRHMPFKLNQSARDRWVRLMDHALDEVKLPKESEDVLRGFFHHMSTFLMNAE